MAASTLKEKLISGGAWALAGKLSVTVSALAINMLLARLLTPRQMGTYFLLFSMVSLAALVAQFGLPQAVVRLVAESVAIGEPGRARAAIRSAFGHATLWGVAIAILVGTGGGEAVLCRFTSLEGGSAVLPLASCWIVALAWQGILAAAFRGIQDLRSSVLFGGTLASFIYLALLFVSWLFLESASLGSVILCSFVSVAAAAVAGTLLLRPGLARISGTGRLPRSELFRVSLPLLVVVVANALLNQSDLWVVGAFGGSSEVAVYGAASKLAGTVPYFLLIVNPVLSPFIAELSVQGRREDLEKLLRNAASLAFIPSLFALAFFLGAGERVLSLFYGGYYRAGSGVLAILSLGAGINVWAGACGLTLMMTGHQGALMKITVISSVATVAASVLAGARFGATGVALATSCGLICQNVAMLLVVKRKLGIWTHARCSFPDLRGLFEGRRA